MTSKVTDQDWADRIRALRDRLRYTQEGLARRIGVTAATVNGWERGRHRPSPMAEAMLRALEGSPYHGEWEAK